MGQKKTKKNKKKQKKNKKKQKKTKKNKKKKKNKKMRMMMKKQKQCRSQLIEMATTCWKEKKMPTMKMRMMKTILIVIASFLVLLVAILGNQLGGEEEGCCAFSF